MFSHDLTICIRSVHLLPVPVVTIKSGDNEIPRPLIVVVIQIYFIEKRYLTLWFKSNSTSKSWYWRGFNLFQHGSEIKFPKLI